MVLHRQPGGRQGNIVGVANAIAIGGYGSVFWMWLIALVGGATAFVESTLAQIYKKRDEQGGSYGGPSYYIQAALKMPFLGVVFAVALVATYAGGFNMLASFNLIDSMSSYSFYAHTVTLMGRQFALAPVLGGALLAILVGICIMGSGKRIVKVTGAELLEALEASTYCTPTAIGGFPQVSGITFTVDTTKAYDQGDLYPGSTYYGPKSIQRVTIETVGGKAFDKNATYTIATNDFMAAGGDTYYAFAAASVNYDLGLAMDEVVMDYITDELDGVVTAAAYHWSWGYYVQVYHGKDDNGNTYSTLYAHMNSAPVVSVGQPVEKGKVLGYVGSTGNSTGNHLHLEMKVNNVLVNVMNYLS